MKFTPKHIEQNVNVSQSNALVEFGWLLGGIVLLVGIVYGALLFSVETVVTYMPDSWESSISRVFDTQVGRFMNHEQMRLNSAKTAFAQEVLDGVVASSSLAGRDFRVYVLEEDTVNAIAIPGNKILIYSGLFDRIKTKNELVMLLGHELGHFANRDHLRGLGRGVVTILTLLPLSASDTVVSNMVANIMTGEMMHFSRQQETMADDYGLDVVNKYFGHIGGAIQLYERLEDEQMPKVLMRFTSSHPLTEDRIRHLKISAGQDSMGHRSVESMPIWGEQKETDKQE